VKVIEGNESEKDNSKKNDWLLVILSKTLESSI